MRVTPSIFAIAAIALASALVIVVAAYSTASRHIDSQFKVFYSLDKRQNDRELIKIIDGARKYVYFAIYYFSKENIADALIRAKKRGVTVTGIMDREASVGTDKQVRESLQAAGIRVETQKHPEGIMHMKMLVTDRAYASGSYNWTQSATDANDEVLEIGTMRSVRDRYLSIIKKVLQDNI